MANRPWKVEERRAAAVFGGTRFAANSGGPLDFETAEVIGQVKHVKNLSLAALEVLAVEMEQIGRTKAPPKLGVVVIHRRPGRGHVTPRLVVLTETVWRVLQNSPEAVGTEPGVHSPPRGPP